MKFWVAQNEDGLIHLFNKEPKRVFIPATGLYQWVVENGTVVRLNSTMTSERYVANTNGGFEFRFLADIMGFKRKGYYTKARIIKYEGISTRVAREVEIEFNIKLIKPKF